jgi:DNA-binding CsgD family transcriptional regulator
MMLRQEWQKAPSRQIEARLPVTRQQQRRLSSESSLELAAAYQAGATLLELADRFGIARKTVLAHLDRQGVPRRHLPGMSVDQVGIAAKLYESGMSLATVGKQLGFSPNTVRQNLIVAGVKVRPKPGSRC